MKQIITIFLLMASMLAVAADNDTYVPMIREGRVWEYNAQYFHPGENGRVLHYMRFNGEVEVNGVEYHCFEMYKSHYYKDVKYSDGSYGYEFSKEEERGYPKFLLREEPGKVYALTYLDSGRGEWIVQIRNEKEMAELSVNGEKQFGEYMLYDFTLQEGDFRWMPEGDWAPSCYNGLNYYAFVIATENIEGESCRVMSFAPISDDEDGHFNPEWRQCAETNEWNKMIEGVGIVWNGCLACFNPCLKSAMFQDESYLPDDGSTLSNVYDSDGNIVYSYDPWSPPTVGIDNINVTPESQSGGVYDLMGRRVERVLPGSVYVRDGKKFVGK